MSMMRDSYLYWLLLMSLNSDLKECSIKRSFGPFRTILVPLPFWFEVPSTNNVHIWGISLPTSEMSYAKKSTKTCD